MQPRPSDWPGRGPAATFGSVTRQRLDTLLAERGLAPSRTAAATTIRAGMVRIGRGGERAEKPGELVDEDAALEIEEGRRYVSRGGVKLAAALDALGVSVVGRRALDVGASTGGFTDCLLQRGAARVVALDVAYGELDYLAARGRARDGDRARQRRASSTVRARLTLPTWS